MSFSALVRTFPKRLSRTFSTSFISQTTPGATALPDPPRRKRRTPRVDPKTQSLLPPHKLRAIVSLYHQCDDFITPENLEKRIDAAFIHDVHDQYLSINRIRHEQYDMLLEHQRSAPKMSPWDMDFAEPVPDGSSSRTWSEAIPGRERQIIEALYGVESPRPGVGPLPGYETLMEARRPMQSQRADLTGEAEVIPERS